MKVFALILISLGLIACENSKQIRSQPQQQAADIEVCRNANMRAFLTQKNEIRCSPNDEEYANLK